MIILLPGNQVLNLAHLISAEFTPPAPAVVGTGIEGKPPVESQEAKPATLAMALLGVSDRLGFQGDLACGMWELIAGVAAMVTFQPNGKYTVKQMGQPAPGQIVRAAAGVPLPPIR